MVGDTGEYHRGEMNISEQTATYHFVMGLTKWGSLYLASILLLLVVWFCVPTGGFVTGLIAAVVVAVAGTLLLRDKKDGDAH